MEFNGHHDTRLAAKALREGWPMKPEDRQAAIDHLRKVAADPSTKQRERERSLKALAIVDAQESPATC